MATLHAGAFRLSLDHPLIMGIVNVTPDSFSDGGRLDTAVAAVDHALKLAEQGADILDVGGESTRPGAAFVPPDEEMRRVLPVIEALAARGLVVSVDTRKPEVMSAALDAGAAMVNDVMALREPGALETLAGSQAAVCLMHMQGEPGTMQSAPAYADVVEEIYGFLAARIEACVAAGIEPARIVIDPGFGFGKSLAHNLLLMKRLERFTGLGVPLLVGVSRKSMLGAVTGRPVEQRLAGGLAMAALAVWAGARIIRSHDVAATLDAAGMTAAVLAAREGSGQG